MSTKMDTKAQEIFNFLHTYNEYILLFFIVVFISYIYFRKKNNLIYLFDFVMLCSVLMLR